MRIAVFCLAVMFAGADARGQDDLRGRVEDQNGGAVAGANVEVSLHGAVVARSRSNHQGGFAFTGADAEYAVVVKAPGYNMLTVGNSAFRAHESPTLLRLESAQPGGLEADRTWEYGVLLQGGVGLEERTNFSFLLAGVHLGRILTPSLGEGLFKGDFEYAVEVLPVWQSDTPTFPQLKCPYGATVASQCYGPVMAGGTYRGSSITPIILRWNWTHSVKFQPWVQAAGGVVYTTRKYPGVGDLNVGDPTQTGPAADTSVWNFTPQGGIGAHYFVRPRRSVDFSVNGVHISSASLGDKNPGVNVSLQMSVGYTWWK
jgi:lipid A 3-O-deacylase